MDDPLTEQLTLVPEERPALIAETIPLEELPADAELVGPAPSAELVASVGRYGVLEPIVLKALHEGYSVVDGRRRIKAARRAGLEDVDARVLVARKPDDEAWMGDVLTISAHATRRENPAADVEAIRSLVEQGADERVIRDATGLPLQTIRKRMRLLDLPGPLLEALAEGQLAVSVAERAAKLPGARQAALVERLDEAGRITGADVEELKRASVEQAAAAIPFEQFTAMPGAAQMQPVSTASDSIEFMRLASAVERVVQAHAKGEELDGVVGVLGEVYEQVMFHAEIMESK